MRNHHKLQKDDHILGLINIIFKKDRPFGACQVGKQVEIHYHAKNISIDSNKYGLVIIDNYSHFTSVFFLQDKSETQEVLKKFLRRAQNKFDVKVK
jgi:hypothetical protein